MNLAVLRVAVIKRLVAFHPLLRLQLSEQTDAWERQLRGCETDGPMLEGWGRGGDEADQGRRDCVLTMLEGRGRAGWGQRRNPITKGPNCCA